MGAQLTAPKQDMKYVVPPPLVERGMVRALNLHMDQCWPSLFNKSPKRRRKEAVATTGRFATVSDMPSSTSAEIITGMPRLLIMYAACTRETNLVMTTKGFFLFVCSRNLMERKEYLLDREDKDKDPARRLSSMPQMRDMSTRMLAGQRGRLGQQRSVP